MISGLSDMTRRTTRRLAIGLLLLAWLILSYAVAPQTGTSTPLVRAGLAQTAHDAATSASSTAKILTNKKEGAVFYPVLHVVDGDTIDVQKDGKKVRVRLIGINSPESVDPRRPVQCFGKEASAELARLLVGASVRLETDPSQDTYDKFGRLLAYVFLPSASGRSDLPKNGTGRSDLPENVGLHMIETGYAYEYTYHLPYKYQAEFKAGQVAAERDGRGLWAPGVCGH